MLAHVLEAEGLATVGIASIRAQVEKLRPPRILYCEFPLGRPLGKPGDAPFQRRVIESAFELLKEPAGPVLKDFPETIEDGFDEPMTCPVPPRHDESLSPEVDEVLALRSAYERSLEKNGRTLVGRVVDADGIADAVRAFVKIADGTPAKEVGLKGHPMHVAKDILSYYEEAASALVDHVPAARSAESWFFRQTATGKLLKKARLVLKEAKDPTWFYIIPFTQG